MTLLIPLAAILGLFVLGCALEPLVPDLFSDLLPVHDHPCGDASCTECWEPAPTQEGVTQ